MIHVLQFVEWLSIKRDHPTGLDAFSVVNELDSQGAAELRSVSGSTFERNQFPLGFR